MRPEKYRNDEPERVGESEPLPETINESFDPERFYWGKLVPARNGFEESHEYTASMVYSWISEIEEEIGERIEQKSRIIGSLSGSHSVTKKKDPEPLLEHLSSEYGRPWLRDLEDNLHSLGESDEFRRLSTASRYPRRGSDEEELFEELTETLDRDLLEPVMGELGHYVLVIEDREDFFDEYDAGIGDMHGRGYIGKEELDSSSGYGAVKIFVRKDLVDDFETESANPYTL